MLTSTPPSSTFHTLYKKSTISPFGGKLTLDLSQRRAFFFQNLGGLPLPSQAEIAHLEVRASQTTRRLPRDLSLTAQIPLFLSTCS